jgi:hypothetical protein
MLFSEVDDPVRLYEALGVLGGGALGESPDMLPRAGLYMASGILGRVGNEVFRSTVGFRGPDGIARGPWGPGGGGRGGGPPGGSVGIMACVLMRGSCPGTDCGPFKVANRLNSKSWALPPKDAARPWPGLTALLSVDGCGGGGI